MFSEQGLQEEPSGGGLLEDEAAGRGEVTARVEGGVFEGLHCRCSTGKEGGVTVARNTGKEESTGFGGYRYREPRRGKRQRQLQAFECSCVAWRTVTPLTNKRSQEKTDSGESPCCSHTEFEMVCDIKRKMPSQEVGNGELKLEKSGLKMWTCLWRKDHIKLHESGWSFQRTV